jgi:hypothetical protein
MPMTNGNYLVELGIQTVEKAREEGIVLRLMGAVAFRAHTLTLSDLHGRLARMSASGEALSDLDYVAYGNCRDKVEELLEKLGYMPDRAAQIFPWLWGERPVYLVPQGKFKADIFFDRLEMCHVIDFDGRLEVDDLTIPLAELLLEKMQIVRINEKDLKDAAALLVDHDIGSTDKEIINGNHIARILADDWGFWFTATTNLRKLKNYLPKMVLTPEEQATVETRIDKLLQEIEEEPKTAAWKKRAEVGTKKKWYREVDEI